MNSYNKESLYGSWQHKNDNEEILFTFNRDSTCELNFFNGNGSQKITGNFEVDFSKSPIPLTIRNIPQLNHTLHTIIQFKSFDEIRMARLSTRWRLRPIAFNRDTEMIIRKQ